MPKTTSRQKILNYLRKQAAATPIELAKALRSTPANIRHHLARLLADGLVEVGGRRMEAARGRPQVIYRLSRLTLGDNLSMLSSALLAEFVDGLPESQQNTLLESLAGQISAGQPVTAGMHITRRLAAAVEALNRMHYQAHWEAHATGPRLILAQCPYAAIIESHPVLCRMDKALLQGYLATPVEQIAKQEPTERGLPICVFSVR
jgi:predicted ArsR family transcriptional regulator